MYLVHFIQDIRINIFRLDQSVENSGGMCSAGQLDNILFAARVWWARKSDGKPTCTGMAWKIHKYLTEWTFPGNRERLSA